MTRTDFEAVNARGTTLATFGEIALARAWVKRNADIHPGLHVEEVTVTVTRRRAYMPRLTLVRAA